MLVAVLETDPQSQGYRAAQWTTPLLRQYVREHQALAVTIEDRSAGYGKRHRLDLDFVTTGEFRTLLAAYQDVRELLSGPVTIRTAATAARLAEEPEFTITACFIPK